MKMYVCARMYMFMTFHKSFMFFLLHLLHIFLKVIVNRQRRHNIRNGIVWAQLGHSTCHVQSRCMWLNFEHTKNSNRSKKIPQRRKSNSNLLINSQKKKPESVRIYFGPHWYVRKPSWKPDLATGRLWIRVCCAPLRCALCVVDGCMHACMHSFIQNTHSTERSSVRHACDVSD